MKNNTTKVAPFQIIGISVKTSNENGQAGNDIGALFGRFMSEGLLDKIPNKVDSTLYSLYTDYEGDHTKPYTAILGCKVKNLDTIPEGMIGKSFENGKYLKFTSRGDLTKGFVYGEWLKIWDMNLNRAYTVDFEAYGEKAQNPTDAEIDIFVGIK